MTKEREALEILKQYLRDNNILFFEGSEKQNCIGFPWIDYIQIPSKGYSKIYETYAIEYCIKNNISLDIAKQALEAPQECDVSKCDFYDNEFCSIAKYAGTKCLTCQDCYYKQLHSQEKTFTLEEIREILKHSRWSFDGLFNPQSEYYKGGADVFDSVLSEFEKECGK